MVGGEGHTGGTDITALLSQTPARFDWTHFIPTKPGRSDGVIAYPPEGYGTVVAIQELTEPNSLAQLSVMRAITIPARDSHAAILSARVRV